MQPYLATAKRYWWLITAVLLLVLGSGLVAAYDEYTHTYQSDATIWTQHVLKSIVPANDLSVATADAPAAEQSDALAQLLQTRTFLTEIVARTSVRVQYEKTSDQDEFVADVGRRFRVQRLGTNLVQVSYRAREPGVAAEMVQAAIDLRYQRAGSSRVEQAKVAAAFLQNQYDAASSSLLDAQRQLDRWVRDHRGSLDPADERQQQQFSVAVQLAQTAVQDAKARIDRAPGLATLQQVAEQMDFQVIDQPRPAMRPSGGLRPAATVAAVAVAIGIALAATIVLGITLMPGGLASESQIARLSRAGVLATIPRVPRKGGGRRAATGLRDALLADTFALAEGSGPNSPSKERPA